MFPPCPLSTIGIRTLGPKHWSKQIRTKHGTGNERCRGGGYSQTNSSVTLHVTKKNANTTQWKNKCTKCKLLP